MHLCQCAGESVVSPQKKVGVFLLLVLSLISVATAYLEKVFFLMCSKIKMGEKEIRKHVKCKIESL